MKRPLAFLLTGHDVHQHWVEPIARVGPRFLTHCHQPQHVGDHLGRVIRIRGICYSHMAIGEDRTVAAIRLVELHHVLHDRYALVP